MTISHKLQKFLVGSSWIRKMFEEGAKLKEIHGPHNVFDFSLGNPVMKPPAEFEEALRGTITPNDIDHRYMPNTGYLETREAVAEYLTGEQQVTVDAGEIIMTCGASGALNVILKAILNEGEEVITPRPHFVEYKFYADNHGGVLITVPTKPDFSLDIEAISSAITKKTKTVLIDSPNNPTGQVYSEDSLSELAQLLTAKSKEYNTIIYLVSDEPYRKIIYDKLTVPSIFSCYNESMISTSYSKDISIPGERIGFLAVNPRATYKNELLEGMTFANRVLGFVNAPAIMQRVVTKIQGMSVDITNYARKRDLLCDGLQRSGYEFSKPKGAFYVFPKTPIPDDVEFVKLLQKELIIAVPGSGFGGPGHFRLAFCVTDETITNAIPAFKRVMDQFR